MTGLGIVVGYDGSPGSEDAVTWAAREAVARGSVLTVCLVRAPQYPERPAQDAALDAEAQRSGEDALDQAVQLARGLMGEGEVRPLLAAGPPAAILCERSASAEMVVVGSRGRGGLPGLPIGSVSLQVASHACGRVVVVRGGWQPVPGLLPRPVVVGTEGSPASEAAVKFAFEEAALRGAPLLAICALADSPGVLGGAGRIRADFEQLITRQEQDHREVAVLRRVSDGPAREALLEAGAEAQMVVVGARGRGGFRGMSLGSVSLSVVAYAACPVGVALPGQAETGRQ